MVRSTTLWFGKLITYSFDFIENAASLVIGVNIRRHSSRFVLLHVDLEFQCTTKPAEALGLLLTVIVHERVVTDWSRFDHELKFIKLVVAGLDLTIIIMVVVIE